MHMRRRRFFTMSLSVIIAAGLLVAAPVSAIAANDQTIDYVILSHDDISTSLESDCDVIINGGDNHFTVTVPKFISASGTSGFTSYTVTVEGDIRGEDSVSVIPDKSVTLSQAHKSDVIATISQDKIVWASDEMSDIGNGHIDYANLSAGKWNGLFNFNIGLNSSYIKVTAFDQNGNNLRASATEITGVSRDNLLSTLSESGMADIDNVSALVEVKSNNFESLANTTFDVSNIASEGDKIAILHFNHENQWELIVIATVDENKTVSGNFKDYSPVAFAKITDTGFDYIQGSLNHEYSEQCISNEYLARESTCTEPAYYYYKCKYHDHRNDEIFAYGSPNGHNYTTNINGDIVSQATCTDAAVYYDVCSVCGEQSSTTHESGASLGHDYSSSKNGTLKTAATCTAKAVYYDACTRCGANGSTTHESGNALGHSSSAKLVKSATCTTSAVYHDTCNRCGKETRANYNSGNSLGHSMRSRTLTSGTRKMYGSQCSRCGTWNTAWRYGNDGYGKWVICSCSQSYFCWAVWTNSSSTGSGSVNCSARCSKCGKDTGQIAFSY